MAHAIEKETGYIRYNHGEAVAIGIVGAADISARLGLISAAENTRVTELVKALRLPLKADGCVMENLYEDIFHDKKTVGGRTHWVLMTGIGTVISKNDVPEEVVKQAMIARISR